MNVFDFSAERADGTIQPLADYRGQVLLIVNTATRCGFTPQLDGLEQLHARYRERGFAVLGFPCNQFGRQAPESDADIDAFCRLQYGTTFPTFAKIDVNGKGAHPLFQHLKKQTGFWPWSVIKWNFTKFLVDRNGRVVKRFSPQTPPASVEFRLQQLL